jgi:hypothetical protein
MRGFGLVWCEWTVTELDLTRRHKTRHDTTQQGMGMGSSGGGSGGSGGGGGPRVIEVVRDVGAGLRKKRTPEPKQVQIVMWWCGVV